MGEKAMGDNRSERPEGKREPLGIEEFSPVAATRAWRGAAQVATIGIFVLLFAAALNLARPIVLPVVAAFVVAMLLSPLSERANRYRIPPVLTAIVLWLAVVAVFYGVITLVSAPVVGWINKAPDIGRAIQEKLQLLERPLSSLRDIRNAVLPSNGGGGLNLDLVAIAKQAITYVTPALGQLLIFFVTLFFMLLGRRHLRYGLVRYFQRHDSRLRVLKIINDIEHNLTGYLSVVALINAGVGVGAGLIAVVIGLPDPLAWGVLGFVLNFIPYIGAAVMEIGLFLVTLVTFNSITYALLPLALYIAMALVEGQFLTPSILGRHFTLNPLTVFLSLVFWAWMWGPIGAFLAAPLLIIGQVMISHLFPKDAPELPE